MMAPFEISHMISNTGAERCYLNGMYVLVTQDGEFHFPKDNQRRELSFTMAEQSSLRRGVIEDMQELGKSGQPLSPNWWRQLGNEAMALRAEKDLADPMSSRRRRTGDSMQRRRVSTETFEIAEIISEMKGKGRSNTLYLVRWAGYDAAWEPWRINGHPGDPIETWEPAHRLRETEALQNWVMRTHN